MRTFHATAAAVVLAGLGVAAAPAFALSADEILGRVDANVSYATIRYTGTDGDHGRR